MLNAIFTDISKKMMPALTAALLLYSFTGYTREKDSAVEGVWVSNNGNEKFEIYRDGDTYFGKIVWMVHGDDIKDVHNPDPDLRDRTIVGMDILYGFKKKGNGVYSSGKVYDPGTGNTYKCKIKVDGDIAKVRGYIFVPLLGRTEIAHRLK